VQEIAAYPFGRLARDRFRPTQAASTSICRRSLSRTLGARWVESGASRSSRHAGVKDIDVMRGKALVACVEKDWIEINR